MSIELITIIIFASLLLFLATGFPVAFVLLGIGVIGYLVFTGSNALYAVASIAYDTVTKDVLVSVPLFVFMAAVLQLSGLGTAMYEAMYKWMAGLRGGLAIGTVMICTVLAAMTGITATGVLMMGLLAYPEMRRRGYDKTLAIGSITGGANLGPIIPPSIPMIVIGSYTAVSVGKLFITGILPGLLISLLFIGYIAIRCILEPQLGPPIPAADRAGWKEKFLSLRAVIMPVIMIIVILGGIYAGAFTPTEAGGVGAVLTLACAAINRAISWKNLKESAMTTFRITAMVLWILVGGATFASLLGITGVTHFIEGLLTGWPLPPVGVVAIIMALVFVLGMFIDGLAIMMIVLPISVPIITQLGFDPLWFDFIFVMNIVIGNITPPFGINMFYFKGLGFPDVAMMDIYRGSAPFVIPMLVVLALCIAFPRAAVWLPNMMLK